MTKRNIIATTALYYANGDIHLGHLLETIQADIWVRFQRMQGHNVIFLSGEDCHGAPVMLRAQKLGITPEALIEKSRNDHMADFENFTISYDNYYTTHSDENRELSNEIYNALHANNDIETRTINQMFDPEKQMFLPDRFVKGTCPKCKTEDQYGDNCENCGATYSPTDLINPQSAVSGATPVEKESEHYFFKLTNYEDFLKDWTTQHLQKEVANKMKEWFEDGLRDWDISRDAPYFGFEIPNAPGKYFYVWLDAPVGYIASLQNYCEKNNLDYRALWNKEAKIHHFIGKDIMYFHTLFWPAMLKGAALKTPDAIYIHSFVTVNGQKMSKSRGTFIKASTYAKHLNPEYLRFYYAAKLSSGLEDVDINFEDFRLRINSDVVGKYVNIASRCAGFITKKFDGKLGSNLINQELYNKFINESEVIAKDYEERNFSQAIRKIMALADCANQYIAEQEPWKLIKEEGKEQQVQDTCTLALNLFRVLSVYLKPVLSETVAKAENFLNDELNWDSLQHPLLDHSVNKFKPLIQRVEEENIEAMIEQSKQDVADETKS